MRYKLAKQLKEVGFPQKMNMGDWFYSFISHPRLGVPPQQSKTLIVSDDFPKDALYDDVKIPRLEEVIEELGDGVGSLIKDKDKWLTTGIIGEFETPLEAVSNLYIKLKE